MLGTVHYFIMTDEHIKSEIYYQKPLKIDVVVKKMIYIKKNDFIYIWNRGPIGITNLFLIFKEKSMLKLLHEDYKPNDSIQAKNDNDIHHSKGFGEWMYRLQMQ